MGIFGDSSIVYPDGNVNDSCLGVTRNNVSINVNANLVDRSYLGTCNIVEDSCIHEKSVLETNMEPRFQPPDYEDSILGSKWPTAKNPLGLNILVGDCPFPQESPYQDLLKRKIMFNKRKRYHSLKFVLRLAKC